MAKQRTNSTKPSNGANLGFEQKLWAAADKLRGHMDASEYKHVVLGLIFLKYISDAFEERHAELQKEKHADPEDRDEYAGANVFWVGPRSANASVLSILLRTIARPETQTQFCGLLEIKIVNHGACSHARSFRSA
jgi:type I restriction-modification system DNA methylase subunit